MKLKYREGSSDRQSLQERAERLLDHRRAGDDFVACPHSGVLRAARLYDRDVKFRSLLLSTALSQDENGGVGAFSKSPSRSYEFKEARFSL